MNDFILTLVLAATIASVYQAGRRSLTRQERSLYSLLGSVACIIVAIEGSARELPGMSALFGTAAFISLSTLALAYFKPKTDA